MESLRTPLTVAPGQLSEAVAMPGLTIAKHSLGLFPTTRLSGAATVGFSVSLTVIV